VFKAAVPRAAGVLFCTSPLLRESDSSKSSELCSNIALAFEDRNMKRGGNETDYKVQRRQKRF